MDTPIISSTEAGVRTLILNRPDRLNSFTSPMLADLHDAVVTAGEDTEIRAVLLTGNGRAFSAGQDLSDPAVSGDDADLGVLLDERYNPLVRAMRTLPKPIVVAVNGVAAGAGANIALAGDIVIAARSAKFIQAFSKINLIPDSGGTWMLPRLVGLARAVGLALFGDAVPAEQAKEWGMIWDVVDDEELMPTAREIAAGLAAGPTRAYGAIKQAMDAAATNTLDEQLDLERDLQRELGASDDYREGVAAFMEKRAPHFRGR